MDNSPRDEAHVKRLLDSSLATIASSTGADRVLGYMTWSLVKEGYYSPDELIDLSLREHFTLDNPYSKIRRGTRIGAGAVIKNNTTIDGERVAVGARTVLTNALVSGNDIQLGADCLVSGPIAPSNIVFGANNEIRGLLGTNNGSVVIGNHNKIEGVSMRNPGNSRITVGDHNELCPGLNINCPFTSGDITIGNYNALGRDGGGVISTAYRFTSNWWGDILIGSYVETTRGAEVLGFSMVGWPLTQQQENAAQHLLVHGPVSEVASLFSSVRTNELADSPADKRVSLFGVVKVKMCCLAGKIRAKDGTRIQSSYLKDIFIPERCKVYFTVAKSLASSPLQVTVQSRAIENEIITSNLAWEQFPTEERSDGYRAADAAFYVR